MVSLAHLNALYAAACLQATAATDHPTPALSWSPFNTFRLQILAGKMYQSTYEEGVDAVVNSGMRDAGYEVIGTLCTGFVGRDSNGKLLENRTLWPTGLKAFGEYVHSKGMKFSAYTGAALHGCCGAKFGSKGYEAIDMATFAEWGADAVAVDYCGGDVYHVRDEYQKYVDGIAKSSNPDMKLSVFNLGLGRAWTWAPQMGAPNWRFTSDIANSWRSTKHRIGVLDMVDVAESIPDLNKHTGPSTGSYAMYDQLVVGVPPGNPAPEEPGMTLTEQQSQFSMWCMFRAPLIAGNDVRNMNSDVKAILLNPETIAVNQDLGEEFARRIDVGHQPWRGDLHANVLAPSEMQWARRLANGDVAVLVLNRDDSKTQKATVHFGDFLDGMPGGKYRVRDLQARRDLGEHCENIGISLAPHQTAFLRLSLVDAECAPAPSPTPPSGGCESKLRSLCKSEMTVTSRCEQCAQSHENELRKAGCTTPMVKAICTPGSFV